MLRAAHPRRLQLLKGQPGSPPLGGLGHDERTAIPTGDGVGGAAVEILGSSWRLYS